MTATRITRTAVAAMVVATFAGACGGSEPVGHQVIVLGFDGMDYALARQMISEGKLPNLQRMAESGAFLALETSIPPQSPVAWSDFITGLDAGGHGIFDFLHRDPETMVPYLSTTITEPPGRTLRFGRWEIPLGGGEVVLMRQGVPFWEVLEEQGVSTTIVRMPANFPPSGTAGRELSGMGTPDMLGGYGTYSLFTTAPERLGGSPGGDVQRADIRRGVFNGSLRGPPNPMLIELVELQSDFRVYLDPVRPVVKIEIGDEEIILQEGDWSDWVPVEYPLPLFQKLRGMARFYLKQVRPEFQLYATPVNIDPLDPAMPISTPDNFATELAEGGRFYTQGFPEDTDAISDGLFDEDEFLAQAALAAEEIRRQYMALLEEFEDGFLFNYFGFLDQVSHIMWGATDPEHPAYDEAGDAPYANVIEDLYMEADEIVGETLDRLEELGGERNPHRDVRPRLHFVATILQPEQLAGAERILDRAGSQPQGSGFSAERGLVPHPGLRLGSERAVREPGRPRGLRDRAAGREGVPAEGDHPWAVERSRSDHGRSSDHPCVPSRRDIHGHGSRRGSVRISSSGSRRVCGAPTNQRRARSRPRFSPTTQAPGAATTSWITRPCPVCSCPTGGSRSRQRPCRSSPPLSLRNSASGVFRRTKKAVEGVRRAEGAQRKEET